MIQNLNALAGLTELQVLDISYTCVESIAALQHLEKLRFLNSESRARVLLFCITMLSACVRHFRGIFGVGLTTPIPMFFLTTGGDG